MSKLVYKYSTPNGIKEDKNLTSSSRLLVRVAEKLGIEWKIISGTQIISLTYKDEKKYIYHQVPSTTTALAMYVCNDKKITTNLLKQAGVSVANGYSIKKNEEEEEEYFLEVFKSLKKPLVVKPIDGTWGENVTVDIMTYEKYINAVKSAFSYSTKVDNSIVVEEMFSKGEEYRILATKEKVIGILKKIPANVVGNGIDTIERLISDKNKEDVRTKGGEKESHLEIKTDEKVIQYLSDQKLDLNTVPKKNQKVFLKNFASISQGGDAIDFTDLAHPSVHEITLKAIRAIPGLSFAGIDFMSSDITKEQNKETYIIIEINTSPGFDIHDFPYEGKNRHAAKEFLLLMFPELKTADIG